MKKLSYSFLFVLQVITCDVYGQLQFSSADSVIDYLKGEWAWINSCGGFSGGCIYPDSVLTQRFVFEEIPEVDSIAYQWYISDTLQMAGIAKVFYGASTYGDHWNLDGPFYNGLITYFTLLFDAWDTVTLVDNIADGFAHQYVRNTLAHGMDEKPIDQKIFLYPNPCKNSFSVGNEGDLKIRRLLIMDINGRVVNTIDANFNSIDITGLPGALYLISAILPDGVIDRVLVIE